MKAVKNNKVYTITEEQQKFYVDAGYDILDDDGTVMIHGRGKTVPYEKYAAAIEEKRLLQEQANDEKLQKEVEQMKAEAAEVFPFLIIYCQDHGIEIGKASTISGVLKKIKEAGE